MNNAFLAKIIFLYKIASQQDFSLNSFFRKLWFSVFVATYFGIKSKVLDRGLLNFYHLFFVILSIFCFIFWDIL